MRESIKKALLPALLALCVLLAGCSGLAVRAEASTPTPTAPAATEEPVPTPEPTPSVFRFPDGSEHAVGETRLDLSALTHEQVEETAGYLRQMQNLQYVDLGADRAMTRLERDGTPLPEPEIVGALWGAIQEVPAPETEPERLTWADIRTLVEAAPQAEVEYRFHISNLPFSTLSEKMDINHIKFDDEGAYIREILPCMQKLKYLDMDFCSVSSEKMAEIRDAYPDVDVVWRVWFGDTCSVRTDTERILASTVYGLDDTNSYELRYCTKVKYLDIGHGCISDLSFVSEMRDLEVLIVSLTPYRDLTPLTGLQKLEYFEGCAYHEGGYNLYALGTCPNLKHINICSLGQVSGYESFVNLHNLERLWIGNATFIPQEWVDKIQEANPQAEINTTETTGCVGTWRDSEFGGNVPRYTLLREQFDYDNFDTVWARYYNDPRYFNPYRG